MKDKIKAWLLAHQDEMVEDICSLVRIPSIEGAPTAGYPFGEDCFKALEKSMEIAARCGLETELFKNMVGQASLKPGHVDFGIWAHSDVVPVDGVWTNPPFEPVVRDGRIYGRGATDNKGQLITSIYALRCLKELGVELKHNVGVFAGSNEETGMADIRTWVAENDEPFFNLSPDADFGIGYAEKGVLRFYMKAKIAQKGLLKLYGGNALNIFPKEATAVLELSELNADAVKMLASGNDAVSGFEDIECTVSGDTVTLIARGAGGHSARALGADNPYAKLIYAMDKAGIFPEGIAPQLRFLKDACLDESGDFLGIKCRDDIVGELHFAGTILAFEDGVVSLGCDIRHPMSDPAEELVTRIKKACESVGFTVETGEINPSNYSDPSEPGAVACLEIYNSLAPEYDRKEGQLYTLSGGTYARHFTRGYAFGMSAGNHAHNVDEYVNIDRLIFGALVYALCILKLDEIY